MQQKKEIWNLRTVNLFDGIARKDLSAIIEMLPVEHHVTGGICFRRVMMLIVCLFYNWVL
ncbi:MAG: hypothetical protein Q9P01_22350 [Anaerolineae bacterium]|nr:hypothetical protein [Anaerolineae bacterium]